LKVSEHPREDFELPTVRGQGVRWTPGVQEQRVARALAEPVGGLQRVDVVAREQLVVAQTGERLDGARDPQLRLSPAVAELEQLDTELDVGEGPAPELQVELRVLTRRHALTFDAGLHATDVAGVRVGEGTPVHRFAHECADPAADLATAGDEPRLHERLAFPGEAPLVVVARVRAERPRQGTPASLRSQARVDRVGLALSRHLADL